MAIQIIPATAPNPTALLGYDGTNYRVLLVDVTGAPIMVATLTGSEGLPLDQDVAGKLNVNSSTVGSLGVPFEQDSLGRMHVMAAREGVNWKSLLTDSFGVLYVNLLYSSLPGGIADSAHQDTEITALQKIDDLQNALSAVATDKLRTSVIDSALPSGASTSGNQSTEITALQKIDDLQNALSAVATDKLRTSVIDSALPSGASTSAKQDTMITALQLIDDLRAALTSVNTDSLLTKPANDGATARALQSDASGVINVRTGYDGATWRALKTNAGGNPIASGVNSLLNIMDGYNDRYAENGSDLNPAAGPITKDLSAVPAGEVWVVVNMWAFNATTAKSSKCRINFGGTTHTMQFFTQTDVVRANIINGKWYLKEGDFVSFIFQDNLLNDDLYWGASGYKMKVA